MLSQSLLQNSDKFLSLTEDFIGIMLYSVTCFSILALFRLLRQGPFCTSLHYFPAYLQNYGRTYIFSLFEIKKGVLVIHSLTHFATLSCFSLSCQLPLNPRHMLGFNCKLFFSDEGQPSHWDSICYSAISPIKHHKRRTMSRSPGCDLRQSTNICVAVCSSQCECEVGRS